MYYPVKLPYSYNSIEPFIDEETMFVHYNKHYLGYLEKLNELLKSKQSLPIIDLIKGINKYSEDVRNNAGGYYNHSLFWNMLKPNLSISKNQPYGLSREVINRDFGSFENFSEKIKEAAKKRFGSGWVWWIQLPSGKTTIKQTPYQDNPLMYLNCKILLGIDVWEHAYYLNYQADRAAYINNIFYVLNWDYSNKQLQTK